MRLLLCILLLLLSIGTPAQLRESERSELNDLLTQKINALRIAQQLAPLVTDSSLMQAAVFHSTYMTRYGKLSHNQSSRKTKTPKNRVDRFSDEFEMVGENILLVQEKKKRLKPELIEQLAEEMFQMWKSSPGHYANMIHPDFEYGGLGFSRHKNGTLYVTQVFGKKGIKIPGQLSRHAFGVKASREQCREILSRYDNLVVNMGNAVEVLGDEVALYHHNLQTVKEIITGDRDGVAIDLVTSDQFCCGQENQVDMSEIYDGIMLKPVYKAQLLAANKAESDYRLVVGLGQVPEALQGKKINANLILIKDGKRCAYTVPQYIPSADYRLLPMESRLHYPGHVRLKTKGIISTEEIRFDFNRGVTTPAFTSDQNRQKGSISSVEIFSNSSIEGDAERNELLHQARGQYIKNYVQRYLASRSVRFEMHANENWDLFYYQMELLGLKDIVGRSRDEIRRLVVTDTVINWDSLLHVQRRSYACIHYRGSWKSTDPLHYERNLRSALLANNYPLANQALVKMVEDEAQADLQLDQSILTFFLASPQLVQNASALLARYDGAFTEEKVRFLRHWIRRAEDLSPDAVFNLLILYNQTVSVLLDRWDVRASTLAKVVHPVKVKELMAKQGMDTGALLLNYHLVAINYYGQTNAPFGIDASFSFITNYFKKQVMDLEDELMLCLFFNHWSRYDLTIDHLYKRMPDPAFNERAAFILARTAMAYPRGFTQDELAVIMEKAYEFNRTQWCLWIKMNFQAMRYPQVKEMYCKECDAIDSEGLISKRSIY